MAHQSFFSYGVTRVYPLKWFTPAVVVLFIVATALVSFLNVAATSYELVPQSSQDPNATEANNGWLSKWPSYLVGARASCSSVEIQVRSTIYTNKRAFPYTLSRVWHLEDDGTKIYQGSPICKSSQVHNCNITYIKIQFEATDRSPGQLQISPMDEGSVNGRTYFEMLNTYDVLPRPNIVQSMFFSLNKTESPNIYWGYSLLGTYWLTIMQQFFDENMLRKSPPFFKGVVGLERNIALKGTIEEQVNDIEFLKFGSCFFISLNATGVAFTNNRYRNTTSITELANSPDHPATFERPTPGIWRSAAALGKAINLAYGVDCCGDLLIYQPGFDRSQFPDVKLRVDQSVIAAEYLCQVPQLKSAGNLIISAIWKSFVMIVDKSCVKSMEEARYCATCTPQVETVNSPGHYESVAEQEPEMVLLDNQTHLQIPLKR
ncbi:hypothetical protein F5Y11DRAFT_357706 [Daldinia sp. FL1419]|nr:hypothetical protein F5Y11DRAFT_357706 [Daldinia sp. FL1419]